MKKESLFLVAGGANIKGINIKCDNDRCTLIISGKILPPENLIKVFFPLFILHFNIFESEPREKCVWD